MSVGLLASLPETPIDDDPHRGGAAEVAITYSSYVFP